MAMFFAIELEKAKVERVVTWILVAYVIFHVFSHIVLRWALFVTHAVVSFLHRKHVVNMWNIRLCPFERSQVIPDVLIPNNFSINICWAETPSATDVHPLSGKWRHLRLCSILCCQSRSIWVSRWWSWYQQRQKGWQLSEGNFQLWFKLSNSTPLYPPSRSALWATSLLPGPLLPSYSSSYSLTSRCYRWIHLTFSHQIYQIHLDEIDHCRWWCFQISECCLDHQSTNFWQEKKMHFLLIWECGNFYCNPCVLSHLSLLNLIILIILLFTWKVGPDSKLLPLGNYSNYHLLDFNVLPHSSLQILYNFHPTLVVYKTCDPATLKGEDDI